MSRPTRRFQTKLSDEKVPHTKIYKAVGWYEGDVTVELGELDDDGIPGVSITVQDNVCLEDEPYWRFSWDLSPASSLSEMQPETREPTETSGPKADPHSVPGNSREPNRRTGKYPTLDEEGHWIIPESLDEILLDVVQDAACAVRCGGRTVYTNAAHRNRVSEPTTPVDGHLRLRELHTFELLNTDGGRISRELRSLGLGSTAFVAFDENEDQGELSNKLVQGRFQLGPVGTRTQQMSVYPVKDLFPFFTDEEGNEFEARAYVLDDIDDKLRRNRQRGIARLIGRTVGSSRVWGQYVVVYRVGDSHKDKGGGAGVIGGRPLCEKGKQKTEAQRERTRVKQRDRRRRARAKKGDNARQDHELLKLSTAKTFREMSKVASESLLELHLDIMRLGNLKRHSGPEFEEGRIRRSEEDSGAKDDEDEGDGKGDTAADASDGDKGIESEIQGKGDVRSDGRSDNEDGPEASDQDQRKLLFRGNEKPREEVMQPRELDSQPEKAQAHPNVATSSNIMDNNENLQSRARPDDNTNSPSYSGTANIWRRRAERSLLTVAGESQGKKPTQKELEKNKIRNTGAGAQAKTALLQSILWALWWILVAYLVATRPYAAFAMLIAAICIRIFVITKRRPRMVSFP